MAYVGKVRPRKIITPDTVLQGNDKKKYRGNSKTKSYNLYDKPMSFEEFRKLNVEQQKHSLDKYLEKYTRGELADYWGLALGTVYNLIWRLNKETKPKELQDIEASKGFKCVYKNEGKGSDILREIDDLLLNLDADKNVKLALVVEELE